MYEKTFGSKYDASLSVKQIAAIVRGEVKAAVKAGTLPKGKYSVRMDHHRSIRVEITPEGEVFDKRYLADEEYIRGPMIQGADGQLCRPSRYVPAVAAALKTVEAMLWAYNYDGSDIQSDYFNVNFYSNVTVCADYYAAREAHLAAQDYAGEAALALSEEAAAVQTPANVAQLFPATAGEPEETAQVRFMREQGLA